MLARIKNELEVNLSGFWQRIKNNSNETHFLQA
jgi:hypothetical protein